MKKIFLLFGLLTCMLVANAQTGTTCISAIGLANGTSCPVYSATPGQITWLQFTPDSTNLTIGVSAMFDSTNLNNRIVQVDLYSGNCGSMTLLESTNDTSMKTMILNPMGLSTTQVYFIKVYNGSFKTDFSVCLEDRSSLSTACGSHVFNGGFESHAATFPNCSTPTTSFSITKANGWMNSVDPFSGTGASLSPDYQRSDLPIAACFPFVAVPRSGLGCAGVGSSTQDMGFYREYILSGATSLHSGSTYKFEFYYQRVTGGDPNNIAVFISPGTATITNPFAETPRTMTTTAVAGGWTKATTYYTHSGASTSALFAIGDYFTGADHITNNYWAIDDVSMIEVPSVTITGPPTFCASATATETFTVNPSSVSAGTTYTWSCSPALPPSSFSSSGNVATLSGPTVGVISAVTYTITLSCTALSGCTSVTTYTFVVTAPPPVPTISSSGPLCSGSTTTLSAPTADLIQWYLNGVLIPGAAGVNYTATAPGTYTVQISYTGGGCPTMSAPYVVNLVTTPTIIIDPSNPPPRICAGSNTLLTTLVLPLGIGGTPTFIWSPSTGLSSATVADPLATPASTTTYTVTGTLSGCSSTASIVVTVNPLPILTVNSLSACGPGVPSVLTTAGTTGASTYLWSTGAVTPSITVSPSVTTSYTVTASSSASCTSTAVATVTVNPIPVVTVSRAANICVGSSTHLLATATTLGAFGYNWMPVTGLSNPLIANPVANPTVTTTYTVTVTNAYGCTGTASVTVTVDPSCCTGSYTVTSIHNTVSSLFPLASPPYSFSGTTIGFDASTAPAPILIVDANTTISSSTVLCAPNATIQINAPYTLTIIRSHLYSCGLDMWDGIVITGGGNLVILNNSLIEDAKIAVRSDNAAGIANFNISTTNFNRNYVGVLVDNFTGPGVHPGLISNSTFGSTISVTSTSNTPLLDNPHHGQSAEVGVGLSNVNSIVIGDPSSTANANNFVYLRTGIRSIGSTYTAYNNNFHNNFPTPSCFVAYPAVCPLVGWAIYNTNSTATIGGNSITAPNYQPNTFKNISNGIYHEAGTTLKVINNTFKNIAESGMLPSLGGTAIKTISFAKGNVVDIENNDMETITNGSFHLNNNSDIYTVLNNTIKSFTGRGVWALQNTGSIMNINSNTFNQSATSAYDGSIAIEVNTAVATSSPDVHILSNQIFRINKGIYLTGISTPAVQSNNIVFAGTITPSPSSYYYGIRAMNTNGEFIQYNTVSKNGAKPVSTDVDYAYGISVESNAVFSTIGQNTITRLGTGIRFRNYPNANASVLCNIMTENWSGLTIDGSNIGQQGQPAAPGLYPNGIANDNNWSNPTGVLSTSFSVRGLGTAPPPTSVPFYTRTAGFPWCPIGTDIIPSGTIITSSNTPTQPTIPSAPESCSNICYLPICTKSKIARIARNESPFNLVTGTQRFSMQEGVLKSILSDTIPLDTTTTDGLALKAFVDTTTANANVGKLVMVSTQFAAGDTAGAIALNNSIVSTQCADSYHQIVNGIFFNTWGIGNFLISPSDSTTLYNIAIQDPMACGTAIYDARVMLGIDVNDFSTAGHMMEVMPTTANTVVADKVGVLYPNPAENSCTYEATLTEAQTGIIMMYDLNGKLISSYKLNNGYNKIDIDLADYSNGIYLYKIFINGQQADYKKLVIAK